MKYKEDQSISRKNLNLTSFRIVNSVKIRKYKGMKMRVGFHRIGISLMKMRTGNPNPNIPKSTI